MRRSLALLAFVALLLTALGSVAQATAVASDHVEATAAAAVMLSEHGHLHDGLEHNARDHVHDQELLQALPLLVVRPPATVWQSYRERLLHTPQVLLIDRPPRVAV
ncbi:MAG: hypothetical protein J0I48_17865 [Devosia sp.]|uniref:hypothetical protein n=1 Tax=Devosia sp. 66-22 TaxID=1895753 RepID=UPI000AB343F7|nr:hypothetical protein [Devosia sp. 66-22]MBN9348037.1 hypothetical protein [Devosia sp.]